jgi:hypothetical protein
MKQSEQHSYEIGRQDRYIGAGVMQLNVWWKNGPPKIFLIFSYFLAVFESLKIPINIKLSK